MNFAYEVDYTEEEWEELRHRQAENYRRQQAEWEEEQENMAIEEMIQEAEEEARFQAWLETEEGQEYMEWAIAEAKRPETEEDRKRRKADLERLEEERKRREEERRKKTEAYLKRLLEPADNGLWTELLRQTVKK